jgi:DNA polymerase III epsilon subunit family exonuclease
MSPTEIDKILKSELVVLDTETTGFYFDRGDEIIELAAEKIQGGEVVDTFHYLIRPSGLISPEASAVNGLTDDFVHANGFWAAEVFPKFNDFIGQATLVGHNIRRFDWPFIASHFSRLGLAIPANSLLDTLELSRRYLILPNHKLGTIAQHFAIATTGAHRANVDVAITRQVLFKILDKI